MSRRIKELWHKLPVVDPHSSAPCYEFADWYLEADIFDTERVTQIDAVMPIIAALGEKLGLPAMNRETAACQ